MNKLLTVISLFFTFLFVSLFLFKCGNNSSTSQGGTNSSVVSSSAINTNDFSDIITVKKGTKVVLDSPDKVIQIWILFNIEQKNWLKELAESIGTKNTNGELDEKSAKFLEEKRKEFYKSYGLTEKDLIQYNKIHSQDIYDFMVKNPKYKKAYDQTM